MKVFDLAKNLPPPAPSRLYCDRGIYQQIKDACEPAEESRPTDAILGFRVLVEEDAEKRKVMALTHSMITGHPVLYVDDSGKVFEVSMPMPEFSPWAGFQIAGSRE